MSGWKFGSMGYFTIFHLLINGTYSGYHPLILIIDPNFLPKGHAVLELSQKVLDLQTQRSLLRIAVDLLQSLHLWRLRWNRPGVTTRPLSSFLSSSLVNFTAPWTSGAILELMPVDSTAHRLPVPWVPLRGSPTSSECAEIRCCKVITFMSGFMGPYFKLVEAHLVE